VFCSACTSVKAAILLYNIREEVRVCLRCFAELPEENRYFLTTLPVLQRGETFVQKGTSLLESFSSSKNIVTIRLEQDRSTLSSTSEKTREVRHLSVEEIASITLKSLKQFEIVTNEGNKFRFEGDDSTSLKSWVECLRAVIAMKQKPSLKQRIETERREKIEGERREADGIKRQLVFEAKREQRRVERENLTQKYSRK